MDMAGYQKFWNQPRVDKHGLPTLSYAKWARAHEVLDTCAPAMLLDELVEEETIKFLTKNMLPIGVIYFPGA